MSYFFPSRERAFAALIRAPLVPAALLFILDASDRVMQSGPLAIVGAAMLSFYILVVMEVASIAIGGPILALFWKRTSFNAMPPPSTLVNKTLNDVFFQRSAKMGPPIAILATSITTKM